MRCLNKNLVTNYSLLLAIGTIWGSQFIFNKMAISALPPLSIATGRIFFGLIVITFLIWILPKRRNHIEQYSKKPWLRLGLISIFEAILPFFLVAWGQQKVNSAIAAILMGTIPIFTIILANFCIKGESFKLCNILSVIIGFLGIIILINPDSKAFHSNVVGEIAILLGSFSFSISIIMLKKLSLNEPLKIVQNILFIAFVPMLILTLLVDKPWELTFTAPALFAVFILGTFCAGIVYVLYIVLLERSTATFASLNNYLVPLFGVCLGCFIEKENLNNHEILALAVIIFALIVNSMPLQRKKLKTHSDASSPNVI